MTTTPDEKDSAKAEPEKDLMLPKVGIEIENSKLESLVPTLLNIVAVTDRAVGTLWIKPQV